MNNLSVGKAESRKSKTDYPDDSMLEAEDKCRESIARKL